jgi:hypothetical protein
MLKGLNSKNKPKLVYCDSASRDILYARQAPSSEKKYNNLADIFMKK